MHDPRVTPARPDLAAKHLEGQIKAERYVDGVEHTVTAGLAPVRRAPSPDAALDTQALKGERVTIYERKDGWAWGQLHSDSYVGWLPADALKDAQAAPTHKVVALRTFSFPEASIKAPPCDALPLGAQIAVKRLDETFAETADGLYLPARHIAPLEAAEGDFVAVAERFAGTPYLWGGKSGLGIDCSGLVQVALAAAGIKAPRDSDMQQDATGVAIEVPDLKNLMRGDLIFWSGHVAIVRDAQSLIHANAFHMMTAIEPTAEAIARIMASGNDVVTVKRIGR